jgi:hypothetical protein
LYYEKLMNTYNDSECHNYFPHHVLTAFDHFIHQNTTSASRYLSPYSFSFDYELSTEEALRFFMFFTNDDGLLDMLFFFECSNPSCSCRIFLNVNILDMDDEQIDEDIICEECGKDYLISEVITFVKVYFILKNGIIIPPPKQEIKKKDSNSTFQVLKGLPTHLKGMSPLPLDKTNLLQTDKGDFPAIELTQMSSINKTADNKIISHIVDDFYLRSARFSRA